MNQIEALEELVCAFRTLPGVGLKTAQRYAYKVINSEKSYAENFSHVILQAKEKIGFCKECGRPRYIHDGRRYRGGGNAAGYI